MVELTGDEATAPAAYTLSMIGLIRWLLYASLAMACTLLIFIGMTRMVDGSWIIDKLIWVFPLTLTQIEPADDCDGGPALGSAVRIEGIVGHYRGRGFEPLPNAEVLGYDARGDAIPIEVSERGAFTFATAFQRDEPSGCPTTPAAKQRLRIRARGCAERSVPVTRAWRPHRVLLECGVLTR